MKRKKKMEESGKRNKKNVQKKAESKKRWKKGREGIY